MILLSLPQRNNIGLYVFEIKLLLILAPVIKEHFISHSITAIIVNEY